MLTALLGLAAFLLNLLPLTLSPGIHWLFGGVAYLLVATVFGPIPGMVTAAVAALVTLPLWNHPWAWLIFTLEALTVGFLVSRWNLRTLTAAGVYWAVLGLPLLLFSYAGIMGVGGTTLMIIALKQPVNGLVNAAAVEALLLVPRIRRALGITTSPRLRSALSVLTFTAALLPALVFGAWAGRREWTRSLEVANERVEFLAISYASMIEQYVLLHQQSVRSLATIIASRNDLDPQRLARIVAAEHSEFPGFSTLAVVDAEGSPIYSHAETGRTAEGRAGEFLWRMILEDARDDGALAVSSVVSSGSGRPTVLIWHPILVPGDSVAGYVVGGLELSRLPEPIHADGSAERIRVYDRRGRVVIDSAEPYRSGDEPRVITEWSMLQELRASVPVGTRIVRREGAVTAASQVAANVLVGHATIQPLGWSSWVEHPFTWIEASVAVPFSRLLALLSGFMVVAAVVSTLSARWMAAPLLRLRWAAASLASGQRDVRIRSLPAGAPKELEELATGFDEMADALAGRADELEELSEITRSLASTLETGPLLRQITDAATRLVSADGCGIALLATGDAELRADEYTLGLLRPAANKIIPFNGSLLGWVVQNARPARVTRVQPAFALYGPEVELGRVGSIIAAPMIGRSGPLGALTAVRSKRNNPFSADHLQLLERLARTAAIAVENARLIEAARSASRAKSDFIAAMSHELRTPLNAVLGHLQLLELEIHGPLAAKQQESLSRIASATRHLSGLIEEVLSFARLEAGRSAVELASVSISDLVEEVAAVIEPLAEQKRLSFRLEAPPTDLVVQTDPDKVRQIIINLAGNAIKFTEHGEVRISVETRSNEAREHDPELIETVAVRVSDTGPGIAAADRPRIFEPFEQLDSGLSRRYGGTGLGLYLSAQYAALIGGRIEVESEIGRGSVFSLMIPLAARAADTIPTG
jgi:signal transduction histidine kinase